MCLLIVNYVCHFCRQSRRLLHLSRIADHAAVQWDSAVDLAERAHHRVIRAGNYLFLLDRLSWRGQQFKTRSNWNFLAFPFDFPQFFSLVQFFGETFAKFVFSSVNFLHTKTISDLVLSDVWFHFLEFSVSVRNFFLAFVLCSLQSVADWSSQTVASSKTRSVRAVRWALELCAARSSRRGLWSWRNYCSF